MRPQRDAVLTALAWIIVGALATLGIYAIFSVGVLMLLAAFAVGGALHRRGGGGLQVGGLMALGGSVALIAFGVASLPYRSCTGAPLIVTPATPVAECGGWNPVIYFVPGGALLAAAVAIAAAGRFRPVSYGRRYWPRSR